MLHTFEANAAQHIGDIHLGEGRQLCLSFRIRHRVRL
jgi:hypothetical protein